MKNIIKIKENAEEILRCDRELEKFSLFEHPASDEDAVKNKGVHSSINIKVEGPGAHIVIYALTRIEIDCIHSILNSILQTRKQKLTEELEDIFKGKNHETL